MDDPGIALFCIVDPEGIEPSFHRLKGECSTVELQVRRLSGGNACVFVSFGAFCEGLNRRRAGGWLIVHGARVERAYPLLTERASFR